jgi:PAS domain S-box-containing protein
MTEMQNNFPSLFLDKNGIVLNWSGDDASYYGYSANEIAGKHFRMFYTQQAIEALVPEKLLAHATKNMTAAYSGQQMRKDGATFECNMVIVATYDTEKEVANYSVTTFDLSGSKDQPDFSHSNLEAIINNTNDLVWSIDVNYKLITSNKAFDDAIREVTGRPFEKGANADNLGFSEEKLELFRQYYARAFNGEKFTAIDYNPPPFERWSEISFHPIVENNIITGTACFSHDITAAKQAEAKLKESEYRFRTLIENNTDGIILFTADIKPFYVTNSVLSMLGYTLDELMHMDINAITHPDDRPAVQRVFEKIFTNPGIPIQGHTGRVLHKDGSWRWLAATVTNMLHDPAINGIVNNFRDVTEAKTAELKLHESEYRFRTLIENNTAGIVLFSSDIKPLYTSPSVEQMLGYSKQEMQDIDLFSVVHPDDIAPLQKKFETIFANPGIALPGHTTKMRHKDGSWRWIEATVTNMLHDPAINGIIDNIRDVTEQIISEQKIRHSNRLYAVISQINQTIVHVKDEQTLFDRACEIAIQQGGFKAAWIGIIDEQNNTINLAAQAGKDILEVYAYEKETYRGQNGMWELLKTEPYYVCNNIQESDKQPDCKLLAASSGICSAIVFPIRKSGRTTGILNLYSHELDFFKEEEVNMLQELAGDISFALDVFQNERSRLESETRLKHNTFRLKQAQEVAHFGSWEFDYTTGKVIFSEELCRIFGLITTDISHDPETVRSFIHHEDAARVRKILDENYVHHHSSSFYHRIVRKDGEIRHIHSLAHFDYDDDGNPKGMYGTAHDITEQTFNVMRLNEQNEQLREIANIQSHKVRGPLATLLGLALLIRDNDVSPQTWELLKGIVDSAEKLDKVIREVVNTTYGLENNEEQT